MKKVVLLIAMLFFIGACVTTSSNNMEFLTTAIIKGTEIRVHTSQTTVQELLGKPDFATSDELHYKGKDNEPTYILTFSESSLIRIAKVTPKNVE
ncbi:MAG: hypothetical protein GX654_03685 [Desulfatiglans sp.]|nr:hypothetical protein [Desulfatiglans sp.]